MTLDGGLERHEASRRSYRLKAALLITGVVAALAAALGSYALFTAAGHGSGTAVSGALGAPQTPTATGSGSTVTVGWGAATLTGGTVPAQNYTVERYNSTGTPPISALPAAA